MNILIATSVETRLDAITHAIKKVYGSKAAHFHISKHRDFMNMFFYDFFEEKQDEFNLLILDPTLSRTDGVSYSIISHMIEHQIKKDTIFYSPSCKSCKKGLEEFIVPSFSSYCKTFPPDIPLDIIKRKYRRSRILTNSDFHFVDFIVGEAHDKRELQCVLTCYKEQKENLEKHVDEE